MTTIIEKDSSGPVVLAVFLFALLLIGGFAFAYMNGVFGGKTTLIENNKTIGNNKTVEKTIEKPVEHPTPNPSPAQ